MGKFYTTNQEFANYLTEELGFTYHDRGEEEKDVKYYTKHPEGKQIKVNFRTNLISLLDNKGALVDYSSSYTNNQIKEFLNN